MSNIGERSCTWRPALGLAMTAMPMARVTGRAALAPASEYTTSFMTMSRRISMAPPGVEQGLCGSILWFEIGAPHGLQKPLFRRLARPRPLQAGTHREALPAEDAHR